MTPTEAMHEAIRRAGSRSALARLITVSRQTVHTWRDHAPAERCLAIEEHTGVSRYDLRPDVYGPKPETEITEQPAA